MNTNNLPMGKGADRLQLDTNTITNTNNSPMGKVADG